MGITNLHIYPSNFKFESRILKETASIVNHKLATEVIILSAGDKNQLKEEKIADYIKVCRLIPVLSIFPNSKVSKALFYLEFYLRAFFFVLTRRIDVINCHSLMVLPLGVVLKKIKGIKLIYDPHELETERLGLHGKAKMISKWFERNFIFASDAIIVVSESILKWYESTYQLTNVYLVRNMPLLFRSEKNDLLRKKFKVPSEELIFIYQGFVNEGRSIELYLKAFSKMSHHHLVIMGYGPLEKMVIENASSFPNIHFQPAVKPSEVLDYTSSADIGLSLIENYCLSYYYSLPNKFFEYAMAEIPVVVSNFPDMESHVKKYEIGWSCEVTEQGLVDAIQLITPAQISEKLKNLQRIKDQISWQNEEPVLVKVFERLQLKNK